MKIVCIGRNYAEHIQELNNETPEAPVLFIKPDTALLGKEVPFVIPPFSENIHYEVELVVKICKVGKYIDTKFAHKYYDQVSVGVDFTARDVQSQLKQNGLPWEIAKGFDGSAAVGKWISVSKIQDITNTEFSLTINGEVVQRGLTRDMIYNVDQIISEASKYFTLKTGDLIFTGTPKGVGSVKRGDVLEGELQGNKMFRLNVK